MKTSKYKQPRMESAIRQYANHLRLKNYTPASIRSIGERIAYFSKWCQAHGIRQVDELTHARLQEYQEYLVDYRSQRNEPLAHTSRHAYLRSTFGFCHWLAKAGYLLYDPADGLEMPKLPRKLPHNVLTAQEIERILKEPDINNELGLRDRAMLETLYSSGVRAFELVALRIDDVDLERGTLKVIEGKFRKDRLVPLGERAARWISRYLYEVRCRQTLGTADNTLFLTANGKPFSARAIGGHVRKYINAAGIEKKGSCHLFRHTMATLMLEGGADIRYIQEILGHAQLSSTEIYTKIDITHLKKVHNRTHPAHFSPQDEKNAGHVRNRNFSPIPQPISQSHPPKVRQFWQQVRKEPGSLADLAEKHLHHLLVCGYSEKTEEERRRRLMHFLLFCHERSVIAASDVTRELLDSYQSHLLVRCKPNSAAPLSPAYRMLHLNTVTQFFKWLRKNDHILCNPAVVLDIPKTPKKIPRHILTPDEVEQVFAQPNATRDTGLRDRAILETLYSTGMRRQELIDLTLENLDFERGIILIVQGKGRKDRMVPVSERALHWIDKYLQEVRSSQVIEPSQNRLFLSQQAQPLSCTILSALVTRYVKAANLGKAGSCHILRHSMATAMLENGADVRHIQEILGHADINNTQIYTKVSIQKLKEVHTRTHPARMYPTKTQEILQEIESSER